MLSAQVRWCLSEDYTPQPVDIVIANIIATPLKQLKDLFASVLVSGGTCVLSGLLESDMESILAIYQPDFILQERIQQGEWLRLVLMRA